MVKYILHIGLHYINIVINSIPYARARTHMHTLLGIPRDNNEGRVLRDMRVCVCACVVCACVVCHRRYHLPYVMHNSALIWRPLPRQIVNHGLSIVLIKTRLPSSPSSPVSSFSTPIVYSVAMCVLFSLWNTPSATLLIY